MILKKIEEFDSKLLIINRLEEKIDKFQLQLAENEERMKNYMYEVSKDLQLKASAEEYDKLKQRVVNLENQCNAFHREAVAKECYDKRMNLLIHDLNEKSDWETKGETKVVFEDFLKAGLDIDPSSVSLIDIHRLPQRPVVKNGKRIVRLIIIKVATMLDKARITGSLRKLKAYNENRITKSPNENLPYVYVSDHLPKICQQQKRNLLPQFKEARKNRQKTSRKIINGDYSLLINDKIVTPA